VSASIARKRPLTHCCFNVWPSLPIDGIASHLQIAEQITRRSCGSSAFGRNRTVFVSPCPDPTDPEPEPFA
jgi:hypothetical protein